MLGKILLTLVVIALAVLYLRKRARDEHAGSDASAAGPARDPWRNRARGTDQDPTRAGARPTDLRIAAWVTLAVILGLGATLYYLSWQDARTPVTVLLHRDGTEEPVRYQVRKKDLDERSFVTVEGVRVNVSDDERMEIIGL